MQGYSTIIYIEAMRVKEEIDMAIIDLIVLGMLKKEPLSAYDLQKLVEYCTFQNG